MVGKLLILCSLTIGLMLLAVGPVASLADEEAQVIIGKVVCVACTLKKTEGASSSMHDLRLQARSSHI